MELCLCAMFQSLKLEDSQGGGGAVLLGGGSSLEVAQRHLSNRALDGSGGAILCKALIALFCQATHISSTIELALMAAP